MKDWWIFWNPLVERNWKVWIKYCYLYGYYKVFLLDRLLNFHLIFAFQCSSIFAWSLLHFFIFLLNVWLIFAECLQFLYFLIALCALVLLTEHIKFDDWKKSVYNLPTLSCICTKKLLGLFSYLPILFCRLTFFVVNFRYSVNNTRLYGSLFNFG